MHWVHAREPQVVEIIPESPTTACLIIILWFLALKATELKAQSRNDVFRCMCDIFLRIWKLTVTLLQLASTLDGLCPLLMQITLDRLLYAGTALLSGDVHEGHRCVPSAVVLSHPEMTDP